MTDAAVPPPEVPRTLAFYLPQFHPIPENDEWWGPGFTEWTNVAKARPRYPGHRQPRLPADLGFYDLRLPEARQAQAELARSYGIDGFVYYHYWFNGRRLLERPINDVLASGEPDFPFCIAWANENWTRVWDGGGRHALMEQRYSVDDDRAHIEALRTTLTDRRYIRVGDRPLVLIYRSDRLPDSKATCELWREVAQSWGLPDLYLLRIESSPHSTGDPVAAGFDAAAEFQPAFADLPELSFRQRLLRLYGRLARWSATIVDYDELARRARTRPDPGYLRWPCVTPGFDNTSRRRHNALIVEGSTPEAYGEWLADAYGRARALASGGGTDSGLVFVNAWNEWAEGNYLEPDRDFGRRYLEATAAARAAFASTVGTSGPGG